MKKKQQIDLEERLKELNPIKLTPYSYELTKPPYTRLKFTAPDVKFVLMDDEAKIPTKAHETDMGWDIYGTRMSYDFMLGCYVMHTGLKVEVPEGWGLLIFPRSSIKNKSLMLSNSVGVIDSGYRGEILFYFRPTYSPAIMAMHFTNFTVRVDEWSKMKRREKKRYNNNLFTYLSARGFFDQVGELHHNMVDSETIYQSGDRIGQAVLVPNWMTTFVEVDELSDSERGSGGFGSTGN